MAELEVMAADVTQLEVDAIANAANTMLRHGGGSSVHAASVRALDEAAGRRIPLYASFSPNERATAVARLTGFDLDALEAALQPERRSNELRNTIALLEAARRRTLVEHTRFSHGTH